MRFVEYDKSHEAGYLRFACKVGGASLAKPFDWYGPSNAIVVRRHILIDDNSNPSTVIGAVTTKVQDYVVAGETVQIAVATYPISLGVAEPRYAMAGMLIFRELLAAYPLNFLLGMGPPENNTAARLCSMLGWRLSPVPYLFLPRRLAPLVSKQFAGRSALAGAARLAGRLRLFAPFEAMLRARMPRQAVKLDVGYVEEFGNELDEWWSIYAQQIGFGLVRDSRQVNAMHPTSIGAFERIVFRHGSKTIGFAVLLVPKAQDVRRAMNANVVTLVEFCVLAAYAKDAAITLVQRLWDKGLDAVITNHSHGPAVDALKAAGFLSRATNMYLAVSPALQGRLDAAEVSLPQMVITRADGDGPIGLGVEL